jgi:TPR repeat protein
MYYFGAGVNRDIEQAAALFAEASAAGLSKANFNLGRLYYRGEGVEQDYAAAARHFDIAAGEGHARAQVFLGRMYLLGEGPAINYQKSYYWLTLAKTQEPSIANHFLKQVRAQLSKGEISKVAEAVKSFRPR